MALGGESTKILQLALAGNKEELESYISSRLAEGDEDMETELAKELESCDARGRTAVELAVLLGHRDLLDVLLQRCSAVNGRGSTALHQAAMWGRLDCLKCLVSHGGDIHAVNKHGETPRETAQRYEQHDCASFIENTAARMELQSAIQHMRTLLADTERVAQAKLTKDEKVKSAQQCNAKTEWLNSTPNATVNKINEQLKAMLDFLAPVLAKLEPQM